MTAASAESVEQARGLAEAWSRYPVPWDVKLSPDGKRLAWSWSGIGAACEVYVAPTDASKPPLRLTESKDHVLVRGWSPDSRYVLAGRDKGGDEREQLLLLDPAKPFEIVPLTAETPDFFLYGGVLHPNGKWLFYCAQFDPHDAQGRSGACILRQDLATGEIRTCTRSRVRNRTVAQPRQEAICSTSPRQAPRQVVFFVDVEVWQTGRLVSVIASRSRRNGCDGNKYWLRMRRITDAWVSSISSTKGAGGNTANAGEQVARWIWQAAPSRPIGGPDWQSRNRGADPIRPEI
jgi:hypothetical protein